MTSSGKESEETQVKKFGRKNERASVRLPKTAQQSIPIRRIHRDGIWEVDGKFSRCWRFTDINYAVADEEDKKEMLIQYCALEKALPTDAITKISIVNKRLNPLEFQNLSIDIQPIPTDKALKEIQNQSLAVETDITR